MTKNVLWAECPTRNLNLTGNLSYINSWGIAKKLDDKTFYSQDVLFPGQMCHSLYNDHQREEKETRQKVT